jgi:hypothetical protein
VTVEQLVSEREKLLAQLSGPAALRFGERSLSNRTPDEIRAAIAHLDAEIAKLQSPQPTVFTIQTKRGLEP